MDAAPLALILFVVVACVMAATRPVAPRRRSTRAQTRARRPHAPNSTSPATPAPMSLNRNQWDRRDLVRAVGRDFVDPDAAGLWPSGSNAA